MYSDDVTLNISISATLCDLMKTRPESRVVMKLGIGILGMVNDS